MRTILNPKFLASGEEFGISLAAMGTNQLYVGADRASASPFAPGAAYRFTVDFLPPPALQVERFDSSTVRLFWPFAAKGFLLEQCTALPPMPDTNSWTLIPPPYAQTGISSNGVFHAFFSVAFTTTNHSFFRLRQP